MGVPVGLRIVLFEDCSAFTHVMACTLAKSPNVTLYTGGFSHFVTSMTAPIASGWSESCRVGAIPSKANPEEQENFRINKLEPRLVISQ
jgi:hypothetical protein